MRISLTLPSSLKFGLSIRPRPFLVQSTTPRRFYRPRHERAKMPKDKEKRRKADLKVPKGTKDWQGQDMVIRDAIFATITNVFKRHGAVTIDTPVFELRDFLTDKYGEDSKLIYDLADQGGEICSLRYDLTVPFARFLAMNQDITAMKRYHIAKVYRRDQPAVSKGRMREFYQCDFDIAGTYDPMLPDAECLRIATEIFDELGWQGRYTIKVNNRKLLDGIFAVCGVPEDKFRAISSAVDKLDKAPWEEVRQEMTEQKGLDAAVADRIGEYVNLKGGRELYKQLSEIEGLMANESAKMGMDEMGLFFDYLDVLGVMDRVSFDMSLARGLDYYTGVIYEVVTEDSAPLVSKAAASARREKKVAVADGEEDRSDDPTVGVGSVAAGGRYDELVANISGAKQMPCVGISFGIERIFSITKAKMEREKTLPEKLAETDVYVMAFGPREWDGLVKQRMEIATMLWDAGIKAEFMMKLKPRSDKQFEAAEKSKAPLLVIIGEEELAHGNVKVKVNGLDKDHPEKEGVLVAKTDLVKVLKERIAKAYEERTDGMFSGIAKKPEEVKI